MPAIRFVALGLAGLGVAACSADTGPREVGGTVAGAALGSLLGNRTGAALDDEDRRRAYAAQMWALEVGPSGAPVPWRNPDSGRYGNVVPGPAYELNGVPCRQYTSTMYIDGRPQTERGTACRKPDGTWMVVS
jgi:surface antigen